MTARRGWWVAAFVGAIGLLVVAIALTPDRDSLRTAPADQPPPAVVPWADVPGEFEMTRSSGEDPRTELRVTIDAPVALVAGKVVPYTITLANSTDKPIALEPCPSYGQSIGPFHALLRLNCTEAVDVPPKGAETFAMRFRIPSSAAPGPTQLTWSMVTHDENEVLARSDVTIVNDRYDGPSAADGCSTEATVPPCGPGMVPGHEYPIMAGSHCQFRGLFADGRQWVPKGGPVGDGNGNPPAGWGNPGDLGVVTLIDADNLVFESSTGQRVPMRPRRPDDPEDEPCA